MSLTFAPRIRTADTPADPVRAWLARLPGADLSAFAPAVPPAADRAPAEADAVARAVACPDLFLVHAPDHLAGERVIADLARACPVGRTLVLSPNPAAADRVAERLARDSVVRALADDENPVRPSAAVSRQTSVALGAGRLEQARRDADAAVADADARLSALEKLGEHAGPLDALDAEAADLTAGREAVESVVRSEVVGKEVTALAALGRLKAAREHTARGLVERQIAADEAQKRQEMASADLRKQHADAVAAPAKKSGFFARLLGKAKHGPDLVELEKQIRQAERELGELTARAAAVRAELEAASAADAAEFEKAVQEEVAARRVAFDARLAELSAGRERLLAGVAVPNPPAPHELPAAQREAARELVAAKERAAELNRPAAEVVQRFLAEPRVVVGTPGSLDADPVFRRAPHAGEADESPFALLVLDRAEELTEHDFVRLARLAARWVLVGDASPSDDLRPPLNGSHPRHAPGRNGRAFGPVEVPFAARLARHLDRRTWAVEAGRLVCRLVPLAPEARRDLAREPLLDRPDIELRFAQAEGGEPVLAEVAFPAATPVAEAKSFLFEQLDTILLRPCGAAEWEHTPNAVTARWPSADHGGSDAAWVDLEPGVREKVVGSGAFAFTAAVAFDPAAGWDAASAAAWLTRHLPAHSPCRFAAVPPPRSR